MFGLAPFGDLAFGEGETWFGVFGSTSVTIGVDANYQLFIADDYLITQPEDEPANRPFDGTFEEPLQLEWRVLDDDFVGGLVVATGQQALLNGDGQYDFLPGQFAMDGRPVELRFGPEDELYKNWPLVFRGVAADFDVDAGTVKIDVEDYGYKLDVPLQARLYAGTGGLDGSADLAGKPYPLALGFVLNATLAPVWPSMRLYQAHDGRCQAISGVYDQGGPLALMADYPNVAALLGATIAGGDYATCVAEGYVRVGGNPAGVVTADIEGDVLGGLFAGTTASVIRRIVARATDLVDPDDLFTFSFDRLETLQQAEIGYFAGHEDPQKVGEAIARLMKAAGGFAHFLRDGRLSVTRIGIPVGPPVARFDATNYQENTLSRQRLPAGVNPAPPRWRVGYARNWTETTDPVPSVDDARRSFLAAKYRYGVAESASAALDHPFSKERDPVEAYYRNKADADAEADRRLVQHYSNRAIYPFECDVREGVQLEMGHPIFIQHGRWGLALGRDATVLGMAHNAKAGTMRILAYC